MFAFAWAQLVTYIFLVNPGSDFFRLGLFAFFIPVFIPIGARNPALALAGILWQGYSLVPAWFMPGHEIAWHYRPLLKLRCEPGFWFLCTSNEANLFLSVLAETRLGEGAGAVRSFVENRCQAWDIVWGPLAFSLLMGGDVDRDITRLYRNLGFLHVLVVSGSQFSLLSRLVEKLCTKPFAILYASTAISWRIFRELKFFVDACIQGFLLVYLLASGGTAPCQRAFLVHFRQIYARWFHRANREITAKDIFFWQMLLFPQSWFSLSNLLSWGAVFCLQLFRSEKTLAHQLRASAAIQGLSLALFSRISLSALVLDFFVAPLWDLLLFAALSAIFIQDLGLGPRLSEVLNYVHESLGKIERWQNEIWGSSSLTFRISFENYGRISAFILLVVLIIRFFKVPRAAKCL